ncbi:hypothetical protein LR013_02215 [candidate division NPL-UPA2 bacterium]|nr:hypothetical protein [candidate division NPL-UPA2 bacterium]
MSRPGLGFVKMGGRIRGYVVGLGMTGLFLLSSLAYGEENLLRNPGFEEEREGGYPAHWSAHAVGEATFTRDDTVSRSGRYSVRLEGLEPKCRYMVGQWYIPVEGGKRYRFVVYHRVEWLTAPPSIDIHFYDEDREFIKGERYVVRGGVGTNPNWRPIIKEVRAPERARYTTFRVHLFNALGVVWFDDASLTVIEEEAKEEPLTIRRTEIAPLIDGKINDPAWRGAERITDFVITTFGTPLAEKQTLVHLTYDDENLYVIFEVEEPDMEYIRAEVTERDEGRVWADDSIELFITPHFGITYQFIVNSINTVYDARIVVDDRTARGYRREVDWNSSLESAVYLGKDFWRVEMSIPLAEIEINPEEGEIAAINFIGGHKQRIGEFSSFSPLVGAFYQPGRFSTLSFAREKATLRRSAPLPENPLRIVRAEPLFAELLSDEPGGYKVYVWDHVPYQTGVSFLPPVKYQQLPEEEWKEIVKDHFTRMHESGIMGPPLPWAVARNIWWRTEEQLLAWHEKYGTQSIVATESSAPYNQAVAAGAELLNPQAVKKGARPVISWLDPIYVDKVLEEIRSMAERFKDFPYAWAFVGRDEPVISPWKETRETMGPQSKRWDEEIRQEFAGLVCPFPVVPLSGRDPRTIPSNGVPSTAGWRPGMPGQGERNMSS